MQQTVALHTAARRHLAERHAHWVARYSEIGGGRSTAYTRQERDTFPRYQAAAAMLEGVERLRAEELPSLSVARAQIAAAALEAQTIFTAPPREEIEARAMDEERAAFGRFIRELPVEALAAVEPLPYRRVLSEGEERRVWNALHDEWEVSGSYWYPLMEVAREDVLAFQAPYFRRDVGGKAVQSILTARGISRLWELRESGACYEMDLDLLDPKYTGEEGFWCAPNAEPGWLIYASHEESITVGGDWLIREVTRIWPEWPRYLWTSPFF